MEKGCCRFASHLGTAESAENAFQYREMGYEVDAEEWVDSANKTRQQKLLIQMQRHRPPREQFFLDSHLRLGTSRASLVLLEP
jgi:hypothetical protein